MIQILKQIVQMLILIHNENCAIMSNVMVPGDATEAYIQALNADMKNILGIKDEEEESDDTIRQPPEDDGTVEK